MSVCAWCQGEYGEDGRVLRNLTREEFLAVESHGICASCKSNLLEGAQYIANAKRRIPGIALNPVLSILFGLGRHGKDWAIRFVAMRWESKAKADRVMQEAAEDLARDAMGGIEG